MHVDKPFRLSKKFIEKEILDCDNELEKFGIKTDLVRFPGLKFGINALIVCKKLNKKIIFTEMISLNPFVYDWFYPWLKKIGFNFKLNTDIITDQTVKNTKSGSILVFHDYLQEIGPNRESILIIDKILPELKNRGFKFVTLENASFLNNKELNMFKTDCKYIIKEFESVYNDIDVCYGLLTYKI